MGTKQLAVDTKERLELIKKGVGPIREGRFFESLTGAMLRKLIDCGAVVVPKEGVDINDLPPLPRWYEGLFKGLSDDSTLEAIAFLEDNLRFVAHGVIDADDAVITIDEITTGLNGEYTIPNAPVLTKAKIVEFANLFHRADEFVIGDTYARAWFD